jgi:hypothetical protein
VNRSLLVTEKIIVFFHINMTILVKIRKKLLSERNYVFNSKKNFMLDFEEEFFSHIMINKFVTIHVKNMIALSYVISRNFKIEKINDYQKNEYFFASSKNEHLTIIFNNLAISPNKRAINAQKALKSMINFDKSNKDEIVENFLSEKFKKILNSIFSSNNSFETMLLNKIIVHDNKKIVIKIYAVMNQYLNV